ncbi:MAG TPA: SDR family NAD(P)-dependent oxidoreductase [Marmoricola sp.]|nr:SDR family NAD(P)-dependent oxidoreductase [Marmoricola sp.]
MAHLAVVTGAGSGIGRAIALGLAAEGAQVAAADLDEAGAEETARRAGGITPMPVDVADRAAVDRLRDRVRAELGEPDVLVNAAGWDRTFPFVDTPTDVAERIVAINYLGQVHVCSAFLPGMVGAGEGGRVVNVASDAGRVGSSGEAVYAGAKGGVIALSKSLAREMARHRITVNCVCPGPTDTPLFRAHDERLQEALTRAIPFRRVAQPEEVAAAVLFFASAQAGYITGQVLSVSGGLTMAG